MMRNTWVLVHRCAGLAIALFLIFSGLTGAVISWDHELDEWLNPDLFETASKGKPVAPLELAARIEAADLRASVSFVPLQHEEGHTAIFGVDAKLNPATSELYDIGYNQVFVDPVTGEVQGKREWGAVSLASENLMPFLYKLHFTLHIPQMWGIDSWGVWLLGIVALIWMLDCFVGFYLTLPMKRRHAGTVNTETSDRGLLGSNPNRSWWQRWKPAWQVKSNRLNFDLHRAFALWTWALLFVVAFTAASLNLYRELFFPVLSTVSEVTPGPFEVRTPRPINEPIERKISYARIIEDAKADAARCGWREPAGFAFYSPGFGVFGVGFHEPGNDHGSGGLGVKTLYYDGQDSHYLGDRIPWQGTAADIFNQLQFPVHSGRILGIPGRILISGIGLVVATLSVTGIVIWLRKRRQRVARKKFSLPRLSGRAQTDASAR
ncbi:MAG: PepSY-associated TM helix domain-containing protein [Burkholderiales bacterium]